MPLCARGGTLLSAELIDATAQVMLMCGAMVEWDCPRIVSARSISSGSSRIGCALTLFGDQRMSCDPPIQAPLPCALVGCRTLNSPL